MADSSASSQPSKKSRVADAVGQNAQQVISEDYNKAKAVTLQAVRSGSYLYPIKGIFYFLSHRALWKPFTSKLVPYCSLYVSVVAGMFTFTYLPQLAVLVFVNGPLAVATTVLLILNESAMIVNMVARNYLLQDALLDTFDGTLLSRNENGIVSQGREIKSGNDPISRLGKALKSPFDRFSIKSIVRYFLYLPLNFIPVVGTLVFIFVQARGRGRMVHDRYFQLKKWSQSQRADWLKTHTGPYSSFGLVATLLEMVPIASMFFTYTNAVGAALWAADIEDQNGSMTEGAPDVNESEKSQ